MPQRKFSFLNSPYLLWGIIFVLVPLVIVAYYAFTDADGVFTLENFKTLPNYADIFLVSILYSLIATFICLLIAYPFAYFLTKCPASSQSMQTMLVMLPMWMNLLIRTYSWMNIFEKNGLINSFLGLLGIGPVTFLGTPGLVIFGMVYNYLPYMIIPIYNVLIKIDKSLYESAGDLGCNPWDTIRKVVFPLSLPGVISGITMVFVPSVSTFYISQKLGGGKIQLIGDVIDRQIQANYNYEVGSTISLVLMIIMFICLTFANKFSSDDESIVI